MATSIKTACITTPISTGTKKDLHREQLQRAGLSAALGVQIQAVRHVQEGKEQEYAVGGTSFIDPAFVGEYQRVEAVGRQQRAGEELTRLINFSACGGEGNVQVR